MDELQVSDPAMVLAGGDKQTDGGETDRSNGSRSSVRPATTRFLNGKIVMMIGSFWLGG